MKKSNSIALSVIIAVLAAAGGVFVGILTIQQKREQRRIAKAQNKETNEIENAPKTDEELSEEEMEDDEL